MTYLTLQALVAIAEVSNHICHHGQSANFNVEPMQYNRFLVISLGTGSPKQDMQYSANEAAKWGILGWLTTMSGNTPLFDAFNQASADMVDFHLASVFRALNCEDNYLRIQVLIIYVFIERILIYIYIYIYNF